MRFTMKKFISIFTLASTATFGLFILMAYIIANDHMSINIPKDPVVVTVYQTPDDTPPNIFVRPPLTPPPPPPARPVNIVKAEPITTGVDVNIDSLKIDLPTEGTDIAAIPSTRDSDAQPIVRISPKYPSAAVKNGIEGWVKLAFDINSLGEVINVKVLDAAPKRIFDKAAKRALKKWKYKAKYINGEQVNQQNLSVQLDFNLEQQS